MVKWDLFEYSDAYIVVKEILGLLTQNADDLDFLCQFIIC